jgi:hypothetical protein
MEKGKNYIIQPKEPHLKKNVCKIEVLEVTVTTVYFEVEDGTRKRYTHHDFEKDYRVIEKLKTQL